MPRPANAPVRDAGSERRILDALKRHGPSTASELAALLGPGPVAMRAHLRRLLAAGLVSYEEERRAVGRPVRRFRTTRAADALSAQGYPGFAVALAEAVVAEWGEGGLARALDRSSARLEGDLRATLPSEPSDRLRALAAAQSSSGFMASAEETVGGSVLVERRCPVAAIAARFPILCEHEAALHGRVLGREVALRTCRARGDETCRFAIGPADPKRSP